MVGSIHFEITEEGARIQTHLSHVNVLDKFCIMCLLKRSLGISKEEFEFVNALIQAGLDERLVRKHDSTEVSVSSLALELLNKMKGDNKDGE